LTVDIGILTRAAGPYVSRRLASSVEDEVLISAILPYIESTYM
jgi:hypothetical protein